MLGKTMYATAEAEDLTADGQGRIRVLTEFNEPETEVDMVLYPADEDYNQARTNVHSSLNAAGYRVVGSTTDAVNGIIVPVAKCL